MTYLLDTMVVSYFLQAGRETELAMAAKCCPMVVVNEVREELQNDPVRGGRAFEKWFATSNIELRAIEVESPASTTLARLRNPTSDKCKGLGERTSIALAASDADLTFVTQDKNGIWIALRELWMPGERILGLAVFLRRLYELGALEDPQVMDEIMPLANAPRPTWWASFRSELVSGIKHGTSASLADS